MYILHARGRIGYVVFRACNMRIYDDPKHLHTSATTAGFRGCPEIL